jgi:DNA helicase-2/ATP-dependent DNA helicase PcrA
MPRFVPTPEQDAVIALTEGAHLVTAPPGSGKTQVLTQRIVRLLTESRGQNFRILALTFTTKAAEGMRARIEAEAGDEWRRVTTATFHSFCLDVLQHYGEHIGVTGDLTIYENEDDRIEALARGLTDEGIVVGRTDEDVKALRQLLQQIGRLKRDLVPPSAVQAEPDDQLMARVDVAYAAYDRTLRLFNAVDFDDLLGLAYRLFTEAPRVARHYRRLYRYILVDEAQDTSRAQYEVLRALCGSEQRNVMMVADADQYIYRFAGASDEFLNRFLVDFEAQSHRLSLNFRCAETVVSIANALILHNRAELFMQSEANARGLVTAASYEDEDAEACGVVDLVQELLTQGLCREWLHPTEATEVQANEVCVLGRNRYLLTSVIEELARRDVPCRFSTTEPELFESCLFQTTYYALRVLLNPRDLLSRRNLLAVCGLVNGAGTDLFGESPPIMFSALRKMNSNLSQLLGLFAEASSEARPLDQLITEIQKAARTTSEAQTDETVRALELADLKSFQERWKTYRQRVDESERALHGFLGELSLSSRTVEGPGVHVLTVHAAKGLEYRAVVLVGMNEGSFPDFRSLRSPEDLAEERRNAYVAVTRASRRLHLTRPRFRRMPWGDIKAQMQSRFLTEMKIVLEDLSSPVHRLAR